MNKNLINRRAFLVSAAGMSVAGSLGANVLVNSKGNPPEPTFYINNRNNSSEVMKNSVTIKGAVVCNRTTEKTQWHQCCNSVSTRLNYCYNPIRCTTAKEMGIPEEQFCHSGDHTPVVYAVEGTPEIEKELAKLVDEYFPANGMNADQAQAFLNAYSGRLKYFLTGKYSIIQDIHSAVERTSLYMTLTGQP